MATCTKPDSHAIDSIEHCICVASRLSAPFFAPGDVGINMSTDKRAALLALFKKDEQLTYATAQRKTGVCYETAKLWIDRFRSGDLSCVANKSPGRPPKLSAGERKAAKRHLTRKHGATLSSTTAMVNRNRPADDQVHRSTVARCMSALKYQQVQHGKVSRVNTARRSKATSRRKIAKVKQVLRKVCFTDASFVRFACNQYVRPHRFEKGWELPGTPARPYDSTKYQLVCFYGGIISPEKGVVKHTPLYIIPQDQSLNARYYQKSILSKFHEWGESELGALLELWLQDNASPHTAKTTLRFLENKGMKLLDHVPQSPDLNPIEKCWATFKLLIAQRRPRTWNGFVAAMQEEWHNAVEMRGESAILELPGAMQQVHKSPSVHVKNAKR